MIERARESDEVLAKQIEYLASVLSSIEIVEKVTRKKKVRNTKKQK